MAKLPDDVATWRRVASLVLLAALISCASWMGLVLQTARSTVPRGPSIMGPQGLLNASFSVTGYNADNSRQIPFGDLGPTFLSHPKRLTGLLPVSSASIGQLDATLAPLLRQGTALREIVLLAPGDLWQLVPKALQRVLEKHVGHDHPEITVKAWDPADQAITTPSVLRLLDPRAAPWALVMNHDGLQGLDRETRSMLAGGIIDWRLPYGPRGSPLNSTDHLHPPSWIQISQYHPVLASHLQPPFVFPLELLSNTSVLPHTWNGLSEQIALCNSHKAAGLLIGRQVNPPPRLPQPSFANDISTTPSIALRILRFDVLLSDGSDVQNISPLLCGLLSRGHQLRVLVVNTNLKLSFNPIKRKTRLFTGIEGCSLEFFTINQYMRRREILTTIGDHSDYNQPSDIVLTLKSHSFATFLVDTFWFGGNVLIGLPKADLAFCDWMASFSLREWQSWHIPRVEISVITRDRPDSLSRLLRSLSAARYFGDAIDLRLNLEQDCDFDTLKLAQNYSWPHGSLFLHHRIIHGGLLPAVVESWYPRNNHTYGLLLEDDVELSPLFYAWVKMCILRYRYDSKVDQSPKLFGISLYQQKNVELRPEGRIPFNARTLFSQHALPTPSTPYMSQVPCSWGAVYFPEHWAEFHQYLSLRFSETWLSMDDVVVPNVRSNNWLRSWKKFFIELAYLKGYIMLYPNFEEYMSLSTNHLEYGAHVRTRSKEKRDLFAQPLFPLPESVEMVPGPTHLLDLPGQSLPRYRDLPILNLTAGLATEEDLVQAGEKRRAELCVNIDTPGSDESPNFICGNSNAAGSGVSSTPH